MKKMYISKLLIANFIFPYFVLGQGMEIDWKIRVPNNSTALSIDSEHNIYIGFSNGTLKKISKEGIETNSFSVPNQSSLTLVQAQNNRKIFLFYRDIQQILILDRFSTIPKKYNIADLGSYYSESACISPDGTFWLLENNPQRLKKIDPLRNIVIHEVQHNLGDSISTMRTLGNLLLITDENGLQILDQFGNLNGSVNLERISHLQAIGNTVLVTNPNGLHLIDPYKIQVIEKKLGSPFSMKKAILKLNEKYVIVGDQSISTYSVLK